MKHPVVIYFVATLLLSLTVSKSIHLVSHTNEVEVNENGNVEVLISETPSTGYTWALKNSEDANFVLENHFFQLTKPLAGMPQRFVGQPSKHVFNLKAVKKGTSSVTFELIKEGEKNDNPEKKTLVLTVK
jgi:predicted secreted protein